MLVALGILVTLLTDVLIRAMPVLTDRGGDFLTSNMSARAEQAGVLQGIVGSVSLMIFVVVLAFPTGVAAAVYLEEYARDTPLTRFLNTVIRNLAGVPSIVYGLLGLAVFAVLLGNITGPERA